MKNYLFLLVAALFVPAVRADDRPNVLIIMTDHWFSDAMSCVIGDEFISTPNIDSLAANGMLFSRAYCANPIWREYIWAYYRLIEKVDGEIGRLLKVLRDTGQEENTLILFTSDHGDCHCSHKWNQKTVFYDESTRVPFILSWKGRTPKGTSDILANTGVDTLPTLCDFAGIEPPAGLPGKSLKAPALGHAPDWIREYVVVQNHMAQGRSLGGETDEERRANRLSPIGRMVRSDRYKYCVYSDDRPQRPLLDLDTLSGEHKELQRQRRLLRTVRQESLIDMDNDPGETKNLARDPAYADLLKIHRIYLNQFRVRFGDAFTGPEASQ